MQENITEIVSVLREADDAYFNSSSIMSDDEYDAMREYLTNLAPSHPYLMSVGSPVRGEPIQLTRPMPSLNQLHTMNDLVNWAKRHGVTSDVVIMDKMDGISSRLIFDEKDGFKSAFSRGDALEGSDITRHINPTNIDFPNLKEDVMIRAEVEISNNSHKKLVENGVIDYKTALSSMSGTINRNDLAKDEVYQEIKIFAFEVEYGKTFPTKQAELEWLESVGFDVPRYEVIDIGDLTADYLTGLIPSRKTLHDFNMDGLVVYVNDNELRAKIEADLVAGDNPRGAFKFKARDEANTADIIVSGIEWNISKHGVFKPTVLFEPVNIAGFTISRATGFNAKFIVDNAIGVGTEAKITRTGDVIPYIYEVTRGTGALLPDDEFEWNATGVDIFTRTETREQIINKLTAFSVSMDIDGLREGTITKLHDMCGIKTFEQILLLDEIKLIAAAGPKNGEKILNSINHRLRELDLHVLMGSTTFFGSGVGVRMVKKIVEQLGNDFPSWTLDKLVQIDGFSETNAAKIMDGMEEFSKFYEKIRHKINLSEQEDNNGGVMDGMSVCFTGIRDKNLERYIVGQGGRIQSSVNGKTDILVYRGTSSSKYKKAVTLRDGGQNISIFTIDEFWETYNEA